MSNTYSFTIPIGDWSGDGHNDCRYYQFTSNKPLKDVREAYFKAQSLGVAPNPEGFCSEYEDREVPEDVVEEAAAQGYKINPDDFNAEDMADYVAWYITLGDADLVLKREPELQMLPFYGYDGDKRHIGGFGYGLTGN